MPIANKQAKVTKQTSIQPFLTEKKESRLLVRNPHKLERYQKFGGRRRKKKLGKK